LTLPNYITVFRIFLIPFFFGFLVYFDPTHPSFRWWAFIIFLVAILSDALDGAIARLRQQQTKLGTFLDPLADKLLLLSGFLGIFFSQAFQIKPPLWVVIVIVFRDMFLICGLAIIFLTMNRIPIKPNLLGKLTTFFQMLTLLALLSGWKHSNPLSFLTAAFTIISAVAYLIRGIKILNHPA
jgi:cardiolipin synthase